MPSTTTTATLVSTSRKIRFIKAPSRVVGQVLETGPPSGRQPAPRALAQCALLCGALCRPAQALFQRRILVGKVPAKGFLRNGPGRSFNAPGDGHEAPLHRAPR